MEEQTVSLHPISKIVQHIGLWVFMLFVFLLPIAFNPFALVNTFDFPKWVLIGVVAILMIVFTVIFMVMERKIILMPMKYLIPIGAFIVALLVSVFLSPSTDTLVRKLSLFYGKAGILLGLVFILITSSILLKGKIKHAFSSLVLSGFILSWFQIFSFLGILSKVFNNPIFAAKTFTPLGSQFVLATFLVVTLVVLLIQAIKTEETPKKILMFVIAGVEAIALVFAIAQILPGQPAFPKLLPYSIGWSVLLDQLKNSVTAFFGSGPDSFASAFSKFRPVVMNQSADWFIRYGSSSNEWFTLFTTIGLVGVVAFGFMVLSFIRGALVQIKDNSEYIYGGVGFLLTVLLLTLLPGNIALYFLFFVLAGMVINTDNSETREIESPIGTYGLGAVLIGLSVFFGINIFNASVAEAYFAQSVKYASENKGNDTYYAQIEAIKRNPYAVRYRTAYSNTNLALANSLASKENLTDEDRATITQLVTQSIRESKAAVALDPQNSTNWVNLAGIYRQLISFAQGSDQWAVSSYVQAIRLDSTNPQLRLDLGGLLYSLGAFQEAIDQFKQAISLKPDFPNAYYNLSHAYAKLEQYSQSYAAMQNVVSLIDPNSADHEKALNELKQLQELLPVEARQATPTAERVSELQEPSPAPTPIPEQVKFDDKEKQDLEPPVDEKTTGFEDIMNKDKEATVTGTEEMNPEVTPTSEEVPEGE